MNNTNKITIFILIAMAGIAIMQLFGIGLAGISVCLGVAFFFIDRRISKTPFSESGLDIKSIGSKLKEGKIWLWLLLPISLDALSITFSKFFMPEYVAHVLSRTEAFISLDNVFLLTVQLIILALGEEIAWRAFFQKQVNQFLPILPTLMITSILFAIGHITSGEPIVVIYDVVFIFLNSMVYGIIFYKTKNAYVSAFSHFMANLFSMIILIFL